MVMDAEEFDVEGESETGGDIRESIIGKGTKIHKIGSQEELLEKISESGPREGRIGLSKKEEGKTKVVEKRKEKKDDIISQNLTGESESDIIKELKSHY